ncbi:MAG: hypothetical protein Q9222_003927 [Ikaeria aurantiellina]
MFMAANITALWKWKKLQVIFGQCRHHHTPLTPCSELLLELLDPSIVLEPIYGKLSSAMVDVAHRPAASLHTRPPTPPKENLEESSKLPADHAYQGTLGQNILLDTPDESPSSSSEYFSGSATKPPKRVVFSPWTKYHNPFHSGDKIAVLEASIRPLPPSKECVISHKSILKSSIEKNSSLFETPPRLVLDPDQGVETMLRSATHFLISASRDLRLDGYRTLLGCLAAYENELDTQSLLEVLPGFLECTRRDTSARQPRSGEYDAEIVTAALKVLSIILYTQGFVDAVPDEFCAFVLERAISSLECLDLPKPILDHYMQLLARQKLPQKAVNSERANRILMALNEIEVRVKGNRVVGMKLMIYQRFIVQAKGVMVTRAEEWLEFLFASMSSSIKDIRSRAIAFGTEAALALGTSNTVLQACQTILDRDTPTGAKVVDLLGSRLLELLNTKDEGFHVPQVWAVVILLLRSRRRLLERWEHSASWLSIMERSFNSSDVRVKIQANVAWNKLISATELDTATSLSIIKMLRRPIASQLERKSSDKRLKHARQFARSSLCTLLYYAFRPGVTHDQVDLYWDNLVVPLLSLKSSATKSDHDFVCEVLAGLLSSTQPRIWNPNRAHDLAPLKADELPCLDPKWVRSRAAKIVPTLEKLLASTQYTHLEDNRTAPFFVAWQSLVRAIGDAASKEIKASMETLTAIAHIMSMLVRYWHEECHVPDVLPERLKTYVALIDETINKVGFRAFTDRRLVHVPHANLFEAAETPSSRSGRPQGALNSPIIHVIDSLVNDVRVCEAPYFYAKAISTMLGVASQVASGRRSQLSIMHDLAIDVYSVPSDAVSSRRLFWNCLAKETIRALSSAPSRMENGDSPPYPGHDFTIAARLLEIPVRDFDLDFLSDWILLSDAIAAKVRDEVGYCGNLFVQIEPLSNVIHKQSSKKSSENLLLYGTHIVKRAEWPTSQQDLERARKQLWGPPPAFHKLASPQSFDHIYTMISTLLISSYHSLQSLSQDSISNLIASISSFLQTCPTLWRAICLGRLQHGLATWVEDKEAVQKLWRVILNSIKTVPSLDSALLVLIQDLLIVSSPFNFVESPETKDDPRIKRAQNTPTSPLKHDRVIFQHSAHRMHSPYAMARSPLAKPARPESRRTPKARLRHDNSQIQFAAVDSSPLIADTEESQHLTDHQKEVRERQGQGAAAMFRDLRSSPRRPSNTEPPLELVLHKKQGLTKPLAVDMDPSPTFPPGDAIMNEFLGSSPTPQSVRKGSVDHRVNDDPPSSPPDSPLRTIRTASLHDILVPGNASPSALDPLEDSSLLPKSPPAPNNEAILDDPKSVEPQDAEVVNQLMHEGAITGDPSSEPTHDAGHDMVCPRDAANDLQANNERQSVIAEQAPLSSLTTIDQEQGAARSATDGTDDMNDIVPPVTPTEDELAREQLLRDLEEASSQGNSQVSIQRPSPSSPSKPSRKRKAQQNSGAKSSKRVKLPASYQQCEVVVETRKPVHGEDDCIIIDDRPAVGEMGSSSPIIKRERSSSPLGSSLRTPMTVNRGSRRRTRSMTNRDSMQASEIEGFASHDAVIATQAPSEEHASKRRKTCELQRSSKSTHPAEQPGTEDAVEELGPPPGLLQHPSDSEGTSRRIVQKPSTEDEASTTAPVEDMTSSQVGGIRDVLLTTPSAHQKPHDSSNGQVPPSSSDGDTIPNTPNDDLDQTSRPGNAQPPARSPGQRMLDRFKHLLNDLKQITLWPAEEREMMKVALDVVGQVHESGFRNGRHGQ